MNASKPPPPFPWQRIRQLTAGQIVVVVLITLMVLGGNAWYSSTVLTPKLPEVSDE